MLRRKQGEEEAVNNKQHCEIWSLFAQHELEREHTLNHMKGDILLGSTFITVYSYMVTHQVDENLPLTLICRLRFSKRSLY